MLWSYIVTKAIYGQVMSEVESVILRMGGWSGIKNPQAGFWHFDENFLRLSHATFVLISVFGSFFIRAVYLRIC
jgi:hypothetical protein